ncbi:regulatory protein, MarR [Thermobifida fusca YX]|jgi:DNA-binding MarR family transcriptional regulator|nr:regulatory protein, MarR [Thermobifida fusca YX]
MLMNQPHPSTPASTDASLAAALRMAVGRLARRLRAQRPDSSLSLGQGSALFTLARHGTMTPGALADHEKVQPPSMTRIIAALEERGLVRRRRHPDDGRQQLVEITEEGIQLVQADHQRREAWLTRQLAELSHEDKEVLRRAAEIMDRLSQS